MPGAKATARSEECPPRRASAFTTIGRIWGEGPEVLPIVVNGALAKVLVNAAFTKIGRIWDGPPRMLIFLVNAPSTRKGDGARPGEQVPATVC